MSDPCPVCGSTEAHCYSLRQAKIAPHSARQMVAIEVPPQLGARLDRLAERAEVPLSAAAEWVIWRALAADGGPIPSALLHEQVESWLRLERVR